MLVLLFLVFRLSFVFLCLGGVLIFVCFFCFRFLFLGGVEMLLVTLVLSQKYVLSFFGGRGNASKNSSVVEGVGF